MENIKWFIVKMVFQVIHGHQRHTPQFDEQLRLIQAMDANEAFIKANRAGAQIEETFTNNRNEIVRWVFVNITELWEAGVLSDGAEIYSFTTEVENEKEYISETTNRAHFIQSKISPIFAATY
jgi:hypothetical protein